MKLWIVQSDISSSRQFLNLQIYEEDILFDINIKGYFKKRIWPTYGYLNYFFSMILSSLLFLSLSLEAQQKLERDKLKLGFSYGFGNQGRFPIKNNSYTYDSQFYKIQFNYRIKNSEKWRFEINVESSFYENSYELIKRPNIHSILENKFLIKKQTLRVKYI